MPSGGARESRDNVSALPVGLNKSMTGQRGTNTNHEVRRNMRFYQRVVDLLIVVALGDILCLGSRGESRGRSCLVDSVVTWSCPWSNPSYWIPLIVRSLGLGPPGVGGIKRADATVTGQAFENLLLQSVLLHPTNHPTSRAEAAIEAVIGRVLVMPIKYKYQCLVKAVSTKPLNGARDASCKTPRHTVVQTRNLSAKRKENPFRIVDPRGY